MPCPREVPTATGMEVVEVSPSPPKPAPTFLVSSVRSWSPLASSVLPLMVGIRPLTSQSIGPSSFGGVCLGDDGILELRAEVC